MTKLSKKMGKLKTPNPSHNILSSFVLQDNQFILVALHRHAAASLKAPLLHPVPLQDNLQHIFPTFCCKWICFHPSGNHSITQNRILRHHTFIHLKSFHDLEHSWQHGVFPISAGFRKIWAFLAVHAGLHFMEQDLLITGITRYNVWILTFWNACAMCWSAVWLIW